MPPRHRMRARPPTANAQTVLTRGGAPRAPDYHPSMPRPLPTTPHGPRRRRRADAGRRLVLACPRVSPDWELGALRVLMKPHDWTRGAIEHRSPAQAWPGESARAVVEAARDAVRERLGFDPPVHFPDGGDFFFVAELAEADLDAGRALALAVSRRLPGLWLTLDRLFVRDRRFYRRERGFKFNLVEAANVHLPREVRGKLKGVV